MTRAQLLHAWAADQLAALAPSPQVDNLLAEARANLAAVNATDQAVTRACRRSRAVLPAGVCAITAVGCAAAAGTLPGTARTATLWLLAAVIFAGLYAVRLLPWAIGLINAARRHDQVVATVTDRLAAHAEAIDTGMLGDGSTITAVLDITDMAHQAHTLATEAMATTGPGAICRAAGSHPVAVEPTAAGSGAGGVMR
ncbi:hypothetical protein AB0M43_37220 [Longispora sp. NPDC051575]|uniref:hypothetical protein n=1 Tax=Longispora sp. NPDC051575 TaxID=3154943 RepID=UPI00343AD382